MLESEYIDNDNGCAIACMMQRINTDRNNRNKEGETEHA